VAVLPSMTVCRALPGKRQLLRRYGTSPHELDFDEVEFAQRLADRDRIEYARKALMVEAPRLQEHLKVLSRKGAEENVTRLRGNRKRK
jgi:hypothetical protein